MWGPRLSGPPTFTSGCFCCTRLIVTNDQTNVLNCSLLLNTAVCRRLVMITSGEDECQCLDDQSRVGNLAACSRCPCKPTIAHALRGKNELNLSYPLVPPNFQNVVAPMYTVNVWWGKWQIFYCKFLAESKSKRILKIDLHLAKLLTKNVVGLFLTHSVYTAVTQWRVLYII